MAKTTVKEIEKTTPERTLGEKFAKLENSAQMALVSIGTAGNATIALQVQVAIDATTREIHNPEFLALLDLTSKASGTGFAFGLKFSKDGERKATKEARATMKTWAGIATLAQVVPALRERVAKAHGKVLQKAMSILE